jgi:hypothetical protein
LLTGKFGHQMVVPLSPSTDCEPCSFAAVPQGGAAKRAKGAEGEGGTAEQLPVCAILGNMSKPSATQPARLRFMEV